MKTKPHKPYRRYLREKSYLQRTCNWINSKLPCKCKDDIDSIWDILKEMENHKKEYPHYATYFNREVYIDFGGDYVKIYKTLFRGNKLHMELTDDMQEHPGLTINYKKQRSC